jgi:hypothetical protein
MAALSKEQYRQASAVAQSVVAIFDSSLSVDGKWGSFSMKAYEGLTQSQRTVVDNALNGVAKGQTVKTLYQFRVDTKKAASAMSILPGPVDSDGRWVTASAMKQVIAKVSALTSVSEQVLQSFLDLEAATRTGSNGKEYDRLAVNSLGYSGLFQFDNKGNAWTEAAKSIKDIGPFNPGWKDAFLNTLAAAGYILSNTRVVRKGVKSKDGSFYQYKGPITANIAYLMHNQGAYGMMKIVKGTTKLAGSQSDRAVLVANAAIAEGRQYV